MNAATSVDSVVLIDGHATAELLVSDVGLSFWGGVDSSTGQVIDQHHPLHAEYLCGKILAIPCGRGSCSGSGVMLESLLNNVAPAALVLCEPEDILTLGVLAGQVLFDRTIPVCRIHPMDFKRLQSGASASIANGKLTVTSSQKHTNTAAHHHTATSTTNSNNELKLSESDQLLLDGDGGKGAQLAMQIVVKMAQLQGAGRLVDVTQAHIDACVYNGPSSLMFAERLASMGSKVKVPTTLNSLSVDKRRWQQQGIDSEFGKAASALGDAYMAMGASLSYTCAPYILDSAPAYGEQIVWAESNAVTYANSVIGARTQKYPDFLDICIALTGRAPMTGAHLDSGRQPTVRVHVAINNIESGVESRFSAVDDGGDDIAVDAAHLDDAFWPLLGYHVGAISRNDIPLITGLEALTPSLDDHKAFSAAFATTSSVPMYHIDGHTPEATTAVDAIKTKAVGDPIIVNSRTLLQSWNELNSATTEQVDLICFGNPHFSVTECESLAKLSEGRCKKQSVSLIVTLGRDTYDKARNEGFIDSLGAFGVQFVNDTCWCMIEEPLIPPDAKVLMTNSAKYAHYGPGLVKRPVHFGGLAECVDVACTGQRKMVSPRWLK